MRVEPVQLVRCTSTNRVAQDRLVWIENRELFQEFYRFSQSVGVLEDDVGTNGARYGGDEFNNRLMRQAHRVFEDAAPENPSGNLLLLGKAAIEPVDQNVCINETGHVRRGLLFSNLFRQAAAPDAPIDACGGVRSPGRTNGAASLDSQASLAWPVE